MRWMTVSAAALLALAHNSPSHAQPQAPAPAQRTVVAAAKLASVVDTPQNFRVVNITLKSGDKETLSGATGVVYQVSGSSEVTVNGQATTIAGGTGVYVPTGATASLTAKDGESISMVFQLTEGAASESGAGTVKELYRTAEPLPGLKPGTYDLNLTRVTFPAGMPSNAPHHRTGGAVYYVISGTGANTIAGTTYPRGPGVFIYEPAGLVHQWGNPGSEPLTFVTLNINQEGVPAVAPETPPKP